MIRLVDSSAWIEFLIDSPLAEQIGPELPEQNNWLVPTIVQFELTKIVTRLLGVKRTKEVIAYSTECIVADLDTATALHAARLTTEHKLSTADAIIYATALAHDADILTCDQHFEGLDRIHYVAKPRPS